MCNTTEATTTTEVATTTNKKEIVLRPYQQECVDLINQTESGSHLIVLSTALGKTVIFSHIQRRGRVLILSHREELVHQPEKYYDCSFGVERAEETSHGEEVISASVQTLIHRLDKFSPDDFDTIITDECFPAGTLVDGVPIEQIQVGDLVTAYNHSTRELEQRKVTHVFRKPMPSKMVSINNGDLVCTLNHPVYEINKRRYINAEDITSGSSILLRMRSGNSLVNSDERKEGCIQKIWKRLLLRRTQEGILKKNIFGNNEEDKSEVCFRENEEKQSYEESRNKRKDGKDSFRNKPQTSSSWWKWNWFNRASKENDGYSFRDESSSRICSKNWCKENKSRTSSKSLQNRCSSSRLFNWYRNRWTKSLFFKKKRTRQKEGQLLEFYSVDNVEILECGSSGRYRELQGEGFVYNLEVDSLNNYFANGVLVHNCHHSVAPSYRKIYDYFKPRLHLGFTATPNRADKTGLSEIFDDILFERNLKWGIKNGYLSPIECKRIDVGYDLEGIHTRLGDFAQNELENAIDITTCNEAVAKVYEDYSKGPTIIFAASVSHAENIAELIPGAEVITATTTNRSEILDRFTSGDLRCIVNCMVLTEGTDLPNVETIIMARPTKNVSLYTQMAGRGLRLSPSTNKEKLNLIDCVGASSLNICAAPSLFGINPVTAIENNQAEGDLMTMESRIEKEQNRRQLNKDFWKINETLINLFTEDGEKYSTHNVNYLVMANGDLVCSVGDYKSIRITAEDMVGNCHMVMIDTNTSTPYMNRRKLLRKNIPVQEALDYAYQILCKDFSKNKSIWDLDSMKKWMNQPASLKQVNFINTLYSPAALLRLGVDMVHLNKYQASVLIGCKMARK